MRFTAVLALLVGSTVVLSVQRPLAAPQVGPLDLSGDLAGAPYRIRVPAVWNGTLLVYVHGYRDKADHPGEIDNRTAELVPTADLEAPLLAQGYALAGSAFKDNGWAIEEGLHDTKSLVEHFRNTVAVPDRTILAGVSFGTVIVYESLTRFGGLYDGAITGCGAGAGATRAWDMSADLLVAYDSVFGMPAAWGTPDDLRDDLDFETEVLPKLTSEVSNAANFPRFEFIRLVVGVPGRGLVPPPPPSFFPGWVLSGMFFATEARAELERRAGGAPVETVGHVYTLSPEEQEYLSVLGVPPPLVGTWLAALNAQPRITAQQSSRKYLERYADYNGNYKHPLLSLHGIIDPLLPVSHEAALASTIRAKRQENLLQAYATGVGHCSFTALQILTAINVIQGWVTTGVRPTEAAFPQALGFAPGFVPPAFPQP